MFFPLGSEKKLKCESQSCERAELYVSHSSQVTAMGCTPPKWLPASLLLHLKGYSTLHWAQLERACCFLNVSSWFSVNTVGFQDDPGVSAGDKSNQLPLSPGGFIQLQKLWKQAESAESALCVVTFSNREVPKGKNIMLKILVILLHLILNTLLAVNVIK